MLATWNNGKPTPEFNNAAQAWNHEFYWENLGPNGGGKALPALFRRLDNGMPGTALRNKHLMVLGGAQQERAQQYSLAESPCLSLVFGFLAVNVW